MIESNFNLVILTTEMERTMKGKFSANYKFSYSEELLRKLQDQFNKEYDFLYNNDDNIAGYEEAVEAFAEDMNNKNFVKLVEDFVQFSGDFISSDREAAAFEFACNTLQIA